MSTNKPVNIVTNLTNVVDSQKSTVTVYLDGVPNTGKNIIIDRTFTPKSDHTFTKTPTISFAKTKNAEDYSYSVKRNANGSYTFNVNYFRPTTIPTTDVIEFFASAKLNKAVVTKKIHGWNMDTGFLKQEGAKRLLTVAGDPGATFKIKATENPRIGTEGNETVLMREKTATINDDGVWSEMIKFPFKEAVGTNGIGSPIVYPTSYRVVLTENLNNTFGNRLRNPTVITLNQWPKQVTKFEITEVEDVSWTMPAASLGNGFHLISGNPFSTTHDFRFKWTVSHSANISMAWKDIYSWYDTFTSTQTNSLSTEEFPVIPSKFKYKNFNIDIDNTTTPKTAVLSGSVSVKHGYDGNGFTTLSFNINNVLNHA